MIRGRTLAAAVTPLREAGAALDEEAFGPLVGFLSEKQLDGLLALGTTGEGILLSPSERKQALECFLAHRREGFAVIAHCGAQTTADTVSLARHAAEREADGVAVIAPPYFPLDEAALLEHLQAAASACAPVPFYVYEFERASGYAVPASLVQRLRDAVPNLAGLKVSDSPWDRVEPYLIEGLDVFIGAEALIARGLEAGAAGAVSALATAFPELVRAGDSERLGELRAGVERFPRHAALKRVLARRGVPVREDVRPPLRGLTAAERRSVDELAEKWL